MTRAAAGASDLAPGRGALPPRTLPWAGVRLPAAAVVSPYLYLAPFLILLAAFTYWPLVHTAYLSVVTWNLNPDAAIRFVGFENFARVARSSLFEAALANTGLYLAAAFPLKVIAPIPVAIFLWTLGERGQVWRTVLFLPTLISFVAVSIAWMWILSPLGGYLQLAGQSVGWRLPSLLNDAATALWTIVGIASWKAFGLHVLFYLAGLSRIDRSLVEAMRIDGAGDLTVVRHLVWPMLGPTTLFVTISTAIFTIQQVFTPIDILTQGGPANATTNLFYMTYQYAFTTFDAGAAGASTVILFGLLLAVAVLQFRLLDRRVHYDG